MQYIKKVVIKLFVEVVNETYYLIQCNCFSVAVTLICSTCLKVSFKVKEIKGGFVITVYLYCMLLSNDVNHYFTIMSNYIYIYISSMYYMHNFISVKLSTFEHFNLYRYFPTKKFYNDFSITYLKIFFLGFWFLLCNFIMDKFITEKGEVIEFSNNYIA